MPFTAFHIGAGLLGKGLAPKSQSLLFFSACQVAIDIEPGVRMLLEHGDLHGYTHNPLGAIIVCLACAVVWRWLQDRWYRLPELSVKTLVDTAIWAALSHWLLDAICHQDVWGSRLLHAGMDIAEDAALMMGAVGSSLIGGRFLIGVVRAFLSSRQKD